MVTLRLRSEVQNKQLMWYCVSSLCERNMYELEAWSNTRARPTIVNIILIQFQYISFLRAYKDNLSLPIFRTQNLYTYLSWRQFDYCWYVEVLTWTLSMPSIAVLLYEHVSISFPCHNSCPITLYQSAFHGIIHVQ